MSFEAFEHYLSDDSRRGPAPDGAFSGAAGGAPCGDLVRVSLAVERGRVAASRFDAEGCAATMAAGAAVAEAAEGARRAGGGTNRAGGGCRRAGRALATGSSRRRAGRRCAPPSAQRRGLVRPGPRRPAGGRDRVLVAVSGGVDSAVAALLEGRRGAEVVAVTLKLWADRHTDGARSCCSPEAVVGARALAHGLGLPHLTLDLEEAFRDTVVEGFLRGHEAGRTPNPCVVCNGEVRIDAMLALARRVGASALATGHYARVVDDGAGPLLAAAADAAKDQTYMLSALRPDSLAALRFPLADLTKPQVRELAAGAGLPVAAKRESQDLCFLAGEGKRSFLGRHARLRERAGEIVDRGGRVVGRHRGHHNFTVGQRRGPRRRRRRAAVRAHHRRGGEPGRGRRLALRSPSSGCRFATRCCFATATASTGCKLRYRSRPIGCAVAGAAGRHPELCLELAEPAYGVAPGQTACLMDGELVVGHATIAA